jgi:hypothetical protein
MKQERFRVFRAKNMNYAKFHRTGMPTSDGLANWMEMERVMGIEPTWPAWKAGTLPLSYTRDELAIE